MRVTVTLSPRLLELVDARAGDRPDKSRSATIEEMLEQAELDRQVREYDSQPEPNDDAGS